MRLTPDAGKRAADPPCKVRLCAPDDSHRPLVYRAVDFVEEQASAPSDLQSIFEEVEFLAFRRRVFEANTMYDEIMRRGKFTEAEA